MTEDLKNIDILFSKAFENFKDDSHEQDWQQMSVALNRQNFMRFGITHFNIYYAAIITLITGLSFYIAANKYISTNAPEPKKPRNEESIPATSLDHPIINYDTTRNSAKRQSPVLMKMSTQLPSKTSQKPDVIIDRGTDISNNTLKNDRITNLKSNENDSTSETVATTGKIVEKKKIQRVTIVKKNPVILNDTVIKYKRK